MKITVTQFEQWVAQQKLHHQTILNDFILSFQKNPYDTLILSDSAFEAAVYIKQLSIVTDAIKSGTFNMEEYVIKLRKDLLLMSKTISLSPNTSINLLENTKKLVMANILLNFE